MQGLVDDTQQLPEPMLEALEARHERQGSADAQQSQQRAPVQQARLSCCTLPVKASACRSVFQCVLDVLAASC